MAEIPKEELYHLFLNTSDVIIADSGENEILPTNSGNPKLTLLSVSQRNIPIQTHHFLQTCNYDLYAIHVINVSETFWRQEQEGKSRE